jgi:hypothetical protein
MPPSGAGTPPPASAREPAAPLTGVLPPLPAGPLESSRPAVPPSTMTAGARVPAVDPPAPLGREGAPASLVRAGPGAGVPASNMPVPVCVPELELIAPALEPVRSVRGPVMFPRWPWLIMPSARGASAPAGSPPVFSSSSGNLLNTLGSHASRTTAAHAQKLECLMYPRRLIRCLVLAEPSPPEKSAYHAPVGTLREQACTSNDLRTPMLDAGCYVMPGRAPLKRSSIRPSENVPRLVRACVPCMSQRRQK